MYMFSVGLSPRKDVEKFHVDYSLLIIVGLLFVLLFINTYLYYKLWSLERSISVEYTNSFDIRYVLYIVRMVVSIDVVISGFNSFKRVCRYMSKDLKNSKGILHLFN